jgi:hypothetical protein
MAVCTAILFSLSLVCMENRWGLFARQVTDLTIASQTTWREEFKAYARFPESAKLLSYVRSVGPAVSDRTLTFTLPKTKTPEVWLSEMTKGLDLSNFKKNDLQYEGGRSRSQSCLIEYRKADDLYVFVLSYC